MIRRGEVWVANLNPNRGREIGKIRPVLVIQADSLTSIGSPMIVILPMSTKTYLLQTLAHHHTRTGQIA
ncbi:MAG: type II toxin-antitoxin system PemK/MazF family toxin [Pseudomonadota bacterium]